MRPWSTLVVAISLLVSAASFALSDNYFKNGDLKEGSQGWHGDGRAAFLKPDGTEGDENDPGAVPVLRIALTRGQPRAIFQEFSPKDAPGKLHITVQVYASIDFKRSTHSDDYVEAEDLWPMPMSDFAVRILPDGMQQTADLKPGDWVTVDAVQAPLTATDVHGVYFIVAPGQGVIYIKKPSATP